MAQLLDIPHRCKDGLCPVNGIRDLVEWRSGRDWSNEFVHGLGQGVGFAYLRFASASPPRQVYWGIATSRQHVYLADLLGAGCTVTENRSFRFSWERAREALDWGIPPVIGPLDMFHLPFRDDMYRQRHVPIHYVLLIGYDKDSAYVYDTGRDGIQALSLEELQLAWDVNVPGLGKRNRLIVLDVPRKLLSTQALVRRAILDQCRTMLDPPVSMLGIPAMRKLAREITQWPECLGSEVVMRCLLQVREYLNSPPGLDGDHLTAGRDLYVVFLEEASKITGLCFSVVINHLHDSIAIVPELAAAVRESHLEDAAGHLRSIIEAEAEAWKELRRVLDAQTTT